MHIDLVYHPGELAGRDLTSSCAVVIDLLRATTTMSNALANGASEIRVFSELGQAEHAYKRFEGKKLLAGERRCLPPPGFDLGNSPADFVRERVNRATIFMSTTNGTRAVHACATARVTLVAALVNASATAQAIAKLGLDVVFVCAGVDGAPGGEDIDAAATIGDLFTRSGAGIQISDALNREIGSSSWISNAFDASRLRASPGGRNLIAAGLDRDIDFAARIDCLDCVCRAVYTKTDAAVTRLE